METKTHDHRLKGGVDFSQPSGESFAVASSGVSLVSVGETIIECRLRFSIPFDQLRPLLDQELFNVTNEVLSPSYAAAGEGEGDVVIEASLRPDLLAGLAVKGLRTGPSFVKLFQTLPAGSPIRNSASWFCRTATGPDDQKMFTTLWAYLDLRELAGEETSELAFRTAMVSFADEQMFGAVDGKIGQQSSREKAVFGALIEATFAAGSDDEPSDADATAEWSDAIDDNLADVLIGAMSTLVGDPDSGEVASTSMTDDVAEMLRRGGWEFRQVDNQPVFSMQIQGHHGAWAAYVQVIEQTQQLVFYSLIPESSPIESIPLVAEFVTRANHDLAIGNFELDFESGEVRFKTSIDVIGGRLDVPIVDRLIHTNLAAMDQYITGVVDVMAGTRSPKGAIEAVEANVEP
ncbi:MAG: hypothetical protein ACJAQ9_000960 [Ilumatobacter sp.]|jgi:hypothetical protein